MVLVRRKATQLRDVSCPSVFSTEATQEWLENLSWHHRECGFHFLAETDPLVQHYFARRVTQLSSVAPAVISAEQGPTAMMHIISSGTHATIAWRCALLPHAMQTANALAVGYRVHHRGQSERFSLIAEPRVDRD